MNIGEYVAQQSAGFFEDLREWLRMIRPEHVQAPVGDLAEPTAGLIFRSASSARRWFADEHCNLIRITRYVSSRGFLEIGDLLADLMGALQAESVLVADC
jgi:hypothetical protein